MNDKRTKKSGYQVEFRKKQKKSPHVFNPKNKDHQKLYRMKNISEIHVSENITEYGDFYMIDRMPKHVMTRLIETFKNVDFETKYNNNCGLISGCHEQKRLDKDKSSFWLLHQKKGYDMPKINPFDWKSSNLVTSVEKIVLEGVLQLLKNAIEDAVDQKDILTTMIPGFVTTGKAVHQGYHLDNTEINFDTENEAFIVHIPLCVEGMWLRLAKLEKNKLNETMYHIPFGRGIILPTYQLHSGHYGKEGT